MKDSFFTLTESQVLSSKVRLMRLSGDTSAIKTPGEFVMLSVPEKYLRRPFSVCDWGESWLTLLIERVGDGTAALQELSCGAELSVLTGLGHGFSMDCGNLPLLIGGGTGLSPLVGLSRRLAECGLRPQVLLGFQDSEDVFGTDLFPDADVLVSENVFAALKTIEHDCFYACGSEAMMKELCHREHTPGQVAFDVRMGCGFGACMGCSKKTASGVKRVCRDGPVFRKEDLLWDD